MIGGPKFSEVEQPFLGQLAGMGWETLVASADDPSHGQEDRPASGGLCTTFRRRADDRDCS